MRVFKIMGFYLLAAITLTACDKDNDVVELPQDTTASSKLIVRASSDYDYTYYATAQALAAEIEENGMPELPLSASDWGYYQSVIGEEFDADVDMVNAIVDQVGVFQEMGLKDYMNEKLELKEDTQNMVMEIVEEGSIKGLDRRSTFRALPEREQQMLLAANAVAIDYENNSKTMAGSSRFLVLNIIGAIGGVLTGVAVGDALCGTVCAVVGGLIGGFIGWMSGGAGK